MTPRHYHYVSGEHEAALAEIWRTPADGVFIDLEDGVEPEHKEGARDRVVAALASPERSDTRALIRINELTGPHWLADVRACAPLADRLLVPLLDEPGPLAGLDAELARLEAEHELAPGSRRLHVLIETAGAVVRLAELVAATERVEGLFFGQADFTLSVRASGVSGGTFRPSPVVEWTHPSILLHARAHGLETATMPWAPATDEDAQIAEMRRLYDMGYDALVVGAAAGVERARRAYRPAAEDEAFATGARRAYEDALGSGTMPMYEGWPVEGAMARVAGRVMERGADG